MRRSASASPRRALALALATLGTLWLAPAALAETIVVNTHVELAPANDNACTLREAITAANTNTASGNQPGECAAGQAQPTVRDTIRFAIPGMPSPTSPHVIEVTSAPLPVLTEKVEIDGSTQPGFNGSPVIEIREAAGSSGVLVISATAAQSEIRSLAISDSDGDAIRLNGSDRNVIAGNYIGTHADGSAGTVAGSGVSINGSKNVVGGRESADRNLIRGNGADGITVLGATSAENAMIANSIGANGPTPMDLAIDLAGDGRSLNDGDDSDLGPNGKQNHPVLSAAVPELSLIQGELDSVPQRGYRIEIFASPTTGPGGTGLAQRFIGSVVTVTSPSGHADWGLIAPPGAFTEGELITATATLQGDAAALLSTSEVSEPIAAPECTVEGTDGPDVLTGTEDNDIICAGGGDDVIEGGGGDDFILGGPGNDTLRGGTGSDVFFGEDGFDNVDYSQVASNVNASLATGRATQDGEGSGDTLNTVEALVGGPLDDVLDGDNLDNVIDGRAGNDIMSAGGGTDTVNGGLGDDALNGGDGADQLFGGEGEDIISGGNEADQINGGPANDSLDGGAGNDLIRGEEGADTLAGQQGADVMIGGLENDRLEGGGARDLLSGGPGADRIDGDRGNDGLSGQGGNDRLNGGQGKDRLTGGTGNDKLAGSGQSDRIRGGKGKDLLNGGGGTDKLFGDNGRDRFIGGKGKDLCDGGKGRDRKPAAGCVTVRSIP